MPVVVAAGCTISSESPDAAALSGRAGPASGTTTTATSGDEAVDAPPPPGEAPAQQEAPAAEGDSGQETPTATASGDDATAGETPGDTAAPTEPPTTTTGGDEAPAAGQPAGADQSAEPAAEGATADDAAAGGGVDGEPAESVDSPPPTTGTVVVAETAFDERSKVSTVGIGSVYFGMSPDEAAERVGTVWAGIPAGGADCYVVTPTNGPPGVALWVYHGTVERVDIDTPLLRTQSGLGVGTHLGELRSRLGDKLVVEEHPYLAGWILATFVPTDPNDAAFRIAFDISGGEVIRFRAGRTEIVALEACA